MGIKASLVEARVVGKRGDMRDGVGSEGLFDTKAVRFEAGIAKGLVVAAAGVG